MKTLILILKIILSVLLVLDIFIWIIAHGSGHTIPNRTDWSFALTALILLGLLFIVNFADRRNKRS